MRLEGKTALITGGANGIGAAISRRFREKGANIVVVDLQQADVPSFEATKGPGRVLALKCDVTKAEEVSRACTDALSEFDRIDILVNNAGGSGPTEARTIEETTDDIFNYVMELNVTPILRFSRALLPAMKAAGWGRIINMSSRVRYGVPNSFPTMKCPLGYVVAKGAMVSLTTQFAKELGPFGITCNAIAPGLILPGPDARITKMIESQPAEWQKEVFSKIPVGRPGNGQDIAELALYLASASSGFMTGQTLDIHGGVH
jgi:NAD(P)-dependent dehydrogenase (short-subunit alcohol dehydrogenase family)